MPFKSEKVAALLLEEFITVGDAVDAAATVIEADLTKGGIDEPSECALVSDLVRISFDKKDEDRKKVANLICSLVARAALDATSVEAGMEVQLKIMLDTEIDVPSAREFYAELCANLISEKVIPEGFMGENLPVGDLKDDVVAADIARRINALVDLPLPITRFKKLADSAIEELFSSGDADEACQALEDMDNPPLAHEFVKRVIIKSLESSAANRELTSVLLTKLVQGGAAPQEQVMEGIMRVLARIDDLVLDTPDAVAMLSSFVARAMVDEVVPPALLEVLPQHLTQGETLSAQVCGDARRLLQRSHASSRLAAVWGSSWRPVDELKTLVKQLVEELFDSGDVSEAVRQIKEDLPAAYLHEVVKRVVIVSVERGAATRDLTVDVIIQAVRRGALPRRQLNAGMARVVVGLDDLTLDVPAAPVLLTPIIDALVSSGCLPVSYRSYVYASKSRPGSKDRCLKLAALILDEFILTLDAGEAAHCVADMRAPHLLPNVIESWLLTSLERDPVRRGAGLNMIAALHVRGAVSTADVEKAYERVIVQLPDQIVDVPHLLNIFAWMLARHLEDKVITESLLEFVPTIVDGEVALQLVGEVKKQTGLPLPITVAKKAIKDAIAELFTSSDIAECVRCISEAESKLPNGEALTHEAVSLAIRQSVEADESARELASKLIVALSQGATSVTSSQMLEGFVRVIARIDDMTLDAPTAPTIVGNFLARAVVDEVLPRSFLHLMPNTLLDKASCRKIVDAATVAVETKHAGVRLSSVWGGSEGKSVADLKASVKTTLLEWKDAKDDAEAIRCIKALNEPHFGHEVVKQLIFMLVTEKNAPTTESIEATTTVIKHMLDADVFQSQMVSKACRRVISSLADLELDIPDARRRLKPIVSALTLKALVPDSFVGSLELSTKTPHSSPHGGPAATTASPRDAPAMAGACNAGI